MNGIPENTATENHYKILSIDVRRQFTMGLNFFNRGLYGMAMTWFMIAAKNHHDEAMNKLGEIYFEGLGTEKDFGKAHHFWLQSALRKNKEACHRLACMYKQGIGVPMNPDMAIHWENKAL